MLWQLGRHFDIHLYQYNICEEYWEDLKTEGEELGMFLKTFKNSTRLDTSDTGQFLVYKEENQDNKENQDNEEK